MQEHGFAHLDREVELASKCRELRRARRQVAEIIQPAFADGDYFRLRRQPGEHFECLLIHFGRVMRMNPGRAAKASGVGAHQFDGGARAGNRAAGDHHPGHPGIRGATDHLRAIGVEAVVAEIDADVDERGQGVESARNAACAIVRTMNCSATGTATVVRIARPPTRGRACLGLLLGIFAAHATSAETITELDDAGARMQYAFYTSDSRGIETVLKSLEEFQVEAGLAAVRSYQLAYGNWKLSQLYLQPMTDDRPRANAKSLAAKAAQACARHAKNAVSQDASMAEAFAMQAACEGHSASARAGSTACTTSKPLRSATSLAPDNPRVKMIQALCASGAAADPAAIERWRTVVASFEAAPPSRPGKPDWGHVEALTMLGEAYLQRGDPVAARDALERALVLAPDYRQAQQLLQAAAARPR
jgi:Tetratricopeptide repeat